MKTRVAGGCDENARNRNGEREYSSPICVHLPEQRADYENADRQRRCAWLRTMPPIDREVVCGMVILYF